MIIPGFLIAICTFPGVIVHEAAHLFFCKIRGVGVMEVCFFQLKNPSGYVIHEKTEDFTSTFLISVGPFLINSLLTLVFCFPASIPINAFHQSDPISYFLMWVGLSIGMNAFPSNADARNIWDHAKSAARERNLLAIASFPLVVVIFVANLLRIVWADLLYGVALGVWLPQSLLHLLSR